MKNLFRVAATACCSVLLSFSLSAQITINMSDLIALGDTVAREADTLPSILGPGNAGPNQTWDFSGAVGHVLETTVAVAPSSTPSASSFTSSNLALTNDNLNYLFFDYNASNVIVDGFAGDPLGSGNLDVTFNPDLTLYQFPTNYGNTFSDTYEFEVVVPGSAVSQPVYEVRLEHIGTIEDTVDGWGTLITPVGSYNAIRIKRVEYGRDIVSFKLTVISPWSTLTDDLSTTTSYSWLALETKLAATDMSFDSLGNVARFTYSLIPPAPIADFTQIDLGAGSVQFTDNSMNSPSDFLWQFDDGTPDVTTQNPIHQFAANGTYNVCLTASNVSGSDSSCQSVVVANATGSNSAPIASNETVTMFQDTFEIIDLNDNITDPNGDSMTISIYQNPAEGALVDNGNGTYTYTPATSYVGQDEFRFSACDSAGLCDSAKVTIWVLSNQSPPVADFTWVLDTVTCEITFTDQSQNDPTSWVWDFGDSTSASGEIVTHTFDGISLYTVCLTATNSLGNHTDCKQISFSCVPDNTGLVNFGQETIKVFPNPTDGGIQIESSSQFEELIISNVKGGSENRIKLVNKNLAIEAEDLHVGINILSFVSNGKTIRLKVVKIN